MDEQAIPYSGHVQDCTVDCLALSHDGQTLISGGSDKQIMIWNIQSHQVYKTLRFTGVITNLSVQLINPMTFHVDNKPVDDLFCSKLKRIVEPIQTYEDEEIEIMIKTNLFENEDEQRNHKFDEIAEFYENSSENVNIKGIPLLDAGEEIEKLRAQVASLKRANKQLFTESTKLILGGEPSRKGKKRKTKSAEGTDAKQ